MIEWLHFHFSLSCIGEGNGNPLQCSCLENPRDGGAWWAAVYGVAQGQTRLKWLSSSSILFSTVAASIYILTNKAQGFCFSISSLTLVIFFLFFNISHLSRYEVMFQCDFFSFLNFFAAAAAKSLQSCPTLCDPIDGSPRGSPVPGILQARTLEWVAISFFSAGKWKVKVKSLSRVWLLATPWTAAYQAPPSMGFSRQELEFL